MSPQGEGNSSTSLLQAHPASPWGVVLRVLRGTCVSLPPQLFYGNTCRVSLCPGLLARPPQATQGRRRSSRGWAEAAGCSD